MLEELEKDKVYKLHSVREVQLDYRNRLKIARLVGQKPMLRCQFNGEWVDALWDTGSMITLVDRVWLKENFADEEVIPVEEFLEGENLTVRAANKSLIPFDGVVVLRFSLGEGHEGFWVPVLVSRNPITEPIIGYNVIEHLVVNREPGEREMLKSCLKGGDLADLSALIALIETQAADPDFLSEIKTSEQVKIPAGCRKYVRCRMKVQGNDAEQTVYFSPRLREGDDELEINEAVGRLKRGRTNYIDVELINDSRGDLVLKKGEVVGSIHSVSAAIPMMGIGD